MIEFSLVPASNDDKEFIFETYKTVLQEYVDWAWGWDEELQRDGFWTHFPVQKFRLICASGSKVGALFVEESEQYHFIRTVFLRPEFQGLGVGSSLLTQEANRARKAQKLLVLRVIKINPAKSLYDRLGFTVVKEDDVTYFMQLG